MSQFAVMKGEEIISALVSGHIAVRQVSIFIQRPLNFLSFLCLEIPICIGIDAEKKQKKIQGQFDAVHFAISKFPMTNWPSEYSFYL